MSILQVKPAGQCRWDAVSLGEVMIRLDPGDERIRTAHQFRAWEGGGEYNVTRGLRRCFGMRTAVITAIVDNDIGRLLENLILQGGVDMSHVKWIGFDGIGKRARNGLNFTERGFGVRAAKGCSDRGHSAASLLKAGDIDWKKVFHEEGARWFHTGGIYAALSETTPDVILEAMKAAKETGCVISYDLNYRSSLWKDHGGQKRAQEVNRAIAPYVDLMLGNEEDFSAALGFEVEGVDESFSQLDTTSFRRMMEKVVKEYPNLKGVAATLRNAKTATINDWGAVLFYDGQLYEAMQRPNLEIFDRVGGGDSFASGLAYAFLAGKTPAEAVNYGAAHGALAMTTPGDTSMVTLDEIEKIMKTSGARVDR